jgi:O-antigen/teichoic acid export membrane protein
MNFLANCITSNRISSIKATWGGLYRLFKSTAAFAGMTYLGTAANMVQFAVVSTLLTRNELGVYGVWMAVATLTSAISAWGFVPVGIRLATHHGNAYLISVYGTLCSICMSCILVTTAVILDQVFSITKSDPFWLCLACASASLITIREILFIPYHNQLLFNKIGMIRLVSGISATILSIVAICIERDAKSLVISSLIVNAAVFIWLSYDIVRNTLVKEGGFSNCTFIRKLLSDGLPISVMNLSSSMFNRLDWLVLGSMSTKSVLGGYSVVYRLYETSYQITAPFTTKLYPRFCREDSSLSVRLWQIRKKIFLIGAIISLSLIALFPLTVELFWPGKFNDQFPAFIVLISALPLIYMVGILYQYYMSQGMQTYLLKISVMSMALNALLLVILVPSYSATGAAIATTVPQLVQYFHMAKTIKKHIASKNGTY